MDPTAQGRPTPADLDAVLAHLPAIEAPPARASWLREPPEHLRLKQALHDHGFVRPFDHAAWQPLAERYRRDPATIEEAPLADLCNLLTDIVRADRFSAGTFAAAVQSGTVAAILRRLRALRHPPAP